AFRLLGGGAVNEPLYVVRPGPPRPPQAAVGRRADAGIVPAVPIEKIVPPLMARSGKVADLILPVSGAGQPLHRIQVKTGGFVGVGQPFRRMPGKSGARFDL